MNTLAEIPQLTTNALVNGFLWFAIVCLVVWGIIALVRATGITIPQPVWIVIYVLGGILLILLVAKLFSALL